MYKSTHSSSPDRPQLLQWIWEALQQERGAEEGYNRNCWSFGALRRILREGNRGI